ncbi:hypothetical protein [Bacteroides propionicifaciens]|jgi:hypothetical protein|uniref:hypothetical protein n=1 Tax=Bacteroides propionicifaciens TaxID=392838 RepID=UPI0003747BC6|nr:hypothetical protein [Bacteroides propionicifaciens]
MKRLSTLGLSLFLATGIYAQNFGEVVNTVAERLTFSGYAQAGYKYTNRYEKENSFELTRISLCLNAQITHNISATIDIDPKNGKANDFYANYAMLPYLKVKFGQFKNPYSFENQLSASVINLINGGSQAVRYLTSSDGSDILNSSNGGRDIGLMIYGDFLYGVFNYGLAIMNGQGYNVTDRNNHKDFIGSLNMNLGDNLTLGGSFILGKGNAVKANPALGVEEDDNYTRNRWAAGIKYKSDLFSLTSEYLAGKDNKYKSRGCYVTSAFHITSKLDAILSYDYFNTRDFTAEYSGEAKPENTFDDTLRGEIQNNYIAGLQYWFYPKCRVQVQYLYNQCHVEKNGSALMAQLQIGF